MPACTFHPFANERSSLVFFSQISAAPFTLLAGFLAASGVRVENTPVFKKNERERERKRGGRLRDKVPCFVLRVSCEVRGRGIKESRKMNVSHEHHSLPSFQADSIHLLSIPHPPYSALFLSRASVLRVSLRMEACFEPSRNSSRLRPGFSDGQ